MVSVDVKHHVYLLTKQRWIWPSGNAGLQNDLDSTDSASALLCLQKSRSVDSLLTLSIAVTKTLNWLSSLPIVNAEVTLVVTMLMMM